MTSKKKTNRTNGIPINVVVLGIIAGVFVLAWFINQAGLGSSLRTAALIGAEIVPRIEYVSSADFLERDGITDKPTFYKSSLNWAFAQDNEAARIACTAKVVVTGYKHHARAFGADDPFGNCGSLNLHGTREDDNEALDGGIAWREMTNDVRVSVKRGDSQMRFFDTGNPQYAVCWEEKVIADTKCGQVVPKPSASATPEAES